MNRHRRRTSWMPILYRLLLVVYPRSYRARFGDEMLRTFLTDYTRVRRTGPARLAWFSLVSVTQCIWFGLRERLADGPARAPARGGAASLLEVSTALKLLRSAREIPGMVTALAIGVGLTVTAYSLIHPVLLTPLPYQSPDEIVQVWRAYDTWPDRRLLNYSSLNTLSQTASPFQRLAAYEGLTELLDTAAGSVPVKGARVSVDLFDVLGVRAEHGRTFQPNDGAVTGSPPVIVSERLVRSGLSSVVVNDTLVVNGLRHRIVGVMGDSFWFPDRQTDYWVPIVTPLEQLLGRGEAAQAHFAVIARLTAGMTPAGASDRATAQLSEAGRFAERLRVESYESLLTAPVRPALLVLQAASMLVLLLVCLNVGWLFVARARRLRPTFATMRALGASSGRVLLTHVVTAVAVATLATPVAVFIAWLLLRHGLTLESGVFSEIASPSISGHVVTMTVFVTAIASVLSSLPALASVRGNDLLTGSNRTATRGPAFERGALVVQIGLVFAIAAQAVFFADILQRLAHANVGFRAPDFVVVTLERRSGAPAAPAAELVRYKNVLSHLDQRGVRAALTNTFPLTGSDYGRAFGRRISREIQRGVTRTRVVTPSYFHVTGIAATSGRVLSDADAGARRAVVTATPAAYSGDTRRLGETVGIDSGWTIVGVVPPIRQLDFYETLQPEAYLLYDDFIAEGGSTSGVFVRAFIVADTSAGVRATLDIVRSTMAGEMPDVEIRSASHIDDLIAARLGPRRLVAAGATAFAVVALVLAGFGLHGMVSHGLMLRRREIGVRMALGATPARVAVESIRPLATVYTLGIAFGAVLLVSARSAVQAVMVPPPGVAYPSLSIVTVISAIALLSALVAACYRPVRRAASTDPAVSLRVE